MNKKCSIPQCRAHILHNSIKDSGVEKKGIGNGIKILAYDAKEVNGGRINSFCGETRAADIGGKPVHLALYNILHLLMRATWHEREKRKSRATVCCD